MGRPPEPVDLRLWFEAAAGDAGVCVRLSAGGATEPVAEGMFPLEAAQRFRDLHEKRLQEFVRKPLGEGELAEIGEVLGALLPLAVRESLTEMVADLGSAEARLRVSGVSAMCSGLPWELLRLALPSGAAFLTRERDIALCRHEPADGSVTAVPSGPVGPVRALVAWADPRSAGYGPLAHLETEVRDIVALLRGHAPGVEIEELPYATPSALERHLKERVPHMLHFVGHGDALPSGGALVLHGKQAGEHALLYADELAAWVTGGPLRLAVFSARHTAGPRSAAAALARAGVPAALGMRYPLRDRWASEFAAVFYSTLLRTGDVAEAVRVGRSVGSADQPDWAGPALFLSSRQSRLFAPTDDAGAQPPTNLPYRRSRRFVGRQADLERLHAALTVPDPHPVALIGLGGVGKTQMAVEYAHSHRASYPGGVFWVSGHDETRLMEDMASLGRFWSIPEDLSPTSRAARVRDALHETRKPCLLIVDNAEARVSLDLLPVIGPCRVLVTARKHDAVPSGSLELKPDRLPKHEARTLLCGERLPDSPAEEQAACRIVDLLDGLPLALRLTAHHLQRLDISYAEYGERLENHRVSVLEQARQAFVTDTKHDGRIWDAIDLASRSLTAEAMALLRTAACFAGRRIGTEMLRRAGGPLDAGAFNECLAELKDASLVLREERGRVGVHDLVSVHVLGQSSDDERGAAVARVAGVLLEELEQCSRAVDWRAVRAELPHCRAVVDRCREYKVPVPPALLRELGHCAFYHRQLEAAADYFRAALDRSELGVERACLTMHLAEVEQHREHPEAALELSRAAVEQAEHLLPADDPGRAEFYNSLGYVLKRQGTLDEAEAWYRKALALHRQLGERHPSVATCLNNLGALLEERKRFDEALEMYREALSMDEEAFGGEHYKAGIRLNNIGRVLSLLNRGEEALPYHARALTIYEATFGRQHMHTAMTLVYMGDAERTRGEKATACRNYAEALPVLLRYYGAEHAVCRRLDDIVRS